MSRLKVNVKKAKVKAITKSDAPVYKCYVTGKPIPLARIKALQMLGTPPHLWTCVEASQIKPIKGIYMGEAGTSEMRLVDRVYNDSVRSIFRSSEEEARAAEEGGDV